MNYIEIVFSLEITEEYQKDLLIDTLADSGFDTFEDKDKGFSAYISEEHFDETALKRIVFSFESSFPIFWKKNVIAQKNWNEVWESNFRPLIISNKCYVRATFHESRPEFEIEIVIDPKMSFGTGHHQTTSMMMEFVLEQEVSQKRILDMGSGTGILAILASKLGASDITAIDYDPICFDSMIENSRLNSTAFSAIICGSQEAIPEKEFDLILANINRNILLEQIPAYSSVLVDTGILIVSGFFIEDLKMLSDSALLEGLSLIETKNLDNWCAAKFVKQI